MRRLRRWAAPAALLLAAACGGAGHGTDRTLSAAGQAGAAGAPVPATGPTTTAVVVASTSTVPVPPPAPSTTVRRPTTTRAPSPAAPASASAAPGGGPYAPAPPPPGVLADGYAGYGGLTSTQQGDTTVRLQVYPREQYFGETVQVWVGVTHTEAVTAITIDFGDGHVVTSTPLPTWGCSAQPLDGGASQWYVYPAAGRYRITATATVVPCQFLPGPPGGFVGPDGRPIAMSPPTSVIGPAHTVSAGMDMLQRADRPPRPVGPPPGP